MLFAALHGPVYFTVFGTANKFLLFGIAYEFTCLPDTHSFEGVYYSFVSCWLHGYNYYVEPVATD